MPQKNRKTWPGAKATTILGKNVVSSAAKTQCVKLPSACPSARWRFGKDLRDEHPDDRALADGVGGDEGEDARGDDGVVLREESPGGEPERGDVAERADESSVRRPSRSISHRPTNVKTRLVTPMPTDCSSAAFAPSPVISKMRGAK